MKKTLVDLYLDSPNSLILLGESGYGKTTQLKLFTKLLNRKVCIKGIDKVIIPFYIPLGNINQCWNSVNNTFLLSYVKEYFKAASDEEVKDLFKDENYQYVFLLDAANEVINRLNDCAEQVYVLLLNSIIGMLQYDSVHVIISSIGSGAEAEVLGEKVSNEIYDSFEVYVMKDLTQEDVRNYLDHGKDELLDNPHLKNPLFLKGYKTLDEQKRKDLSSKSKLIEESLKKHVLEKRILGLYRDIEDEHLKQVFGEIYPFLSYHAVLSIVSVNSVQTDTIDSLLDDYFDKFDYENSVKQILINRFKEIIEKQKVYDVDRLLFKHQYYMDFFAACLFIDAGVIFDRESQVVRDNLSEKLIEQLQYKGKPDLIRRTRFLAMAEFIVSMCEERERFLHNYISDDLSQQFYQQFAGVYEDLKREYRTDAAKYAWYSYIYLMNNELTLQTLGKESTLLYCMLKDINYMHEHKNKTYNVDWVVNRIINFIDTYEPTQGTDNNTKAIYGKAINNIGAYYTALKDYNKALEWHKKALEYRKDNDLHIKDSCRCIMGDYYHLYKAQETQDFIIEAEGYYRMGINDLLEAREVIDNAKKKSSYIASLTSDDVDYAARGLGILSLLIHDNNQYKFIDEALDLGRFVLEQSTTSRRINGNDINNVVKALSPIRSMNIDRASEFDDLIEECRKYL